MPADGKFFKINVAFESAVSKADSVIRSKHWEDFSVAELKLVYSPYWFFSFDAFEEKENKAISKHVPGKKTLNALTNELSDFLASLLEQKDVAVEKESTKDYPAEVLDAKIPKEEAKEVASVRIASNLGFAKENVLISGLELFFVPFWLTFVTINQETFKIQINAVSGDIIGSERVPEREKGFLELTRETINDLKSPGAWLEYSKRATTGAASFISKGAAKTTSVSLSNINFDWRTIIIIIAILFIIAILLGLL